MRKFIMFRFVFIGDIRGGNIKTSDQANEESLQARWVHNVEDLPLRSNDIIPLIERAKNYIKNKSGSQHPYLMPLSRSFSKLLLQLIVIAKKRATLSRVNGDSFLNIQKIFQL